MPLDFEPLCRFLPTPELRALLEQEIAALGEAPPALDRQQPTVAMALVSLAGNARFPDLVPLRADDPNPLAPWLEGFQAQAASAHEYGARQLWQSVWRLADHGPRGVPVLLVLVRSEALPLRRPAYAALSQLLAREPQCFDAEVLQALVRGVADGSVKVRLAAFQALARHPERARAALAQAAAALQGKALALTHDALARLGGNAEECDAAPRPPDPADAELLGQLAALWASTRAPEVAELVDLLSSQLPAPALGGGSKTEQEREWHAVALRRDPATLASLLAAPWPSLWRDAAKRLVALRGWLDPRISGAWVKLLETQPYPSQASFGFYCDVLEELTALRDARQLEPLRKAGAALIQRFPGYHYITRFVQAARGEALEAALRKAPPRSPEADDPVLARARARLAGVKAAAQQHARTEEEFLGRIYDDPGSEEQRRVYADWLLERGDVRGEFINLQCERETGRGSPGAERRERKILSEHRERLLGPLAQYLRPKPLVFERGFAACVCADTRALEQGAGERAWATVRSVTVFEWLDAGERDSEILARFLSGPGRRVAALHDARAEVLPLLAERQPECALEEIGIRFFFAGSVDLDGFERLKRLSIVRPRFVLGSRDPVDSPATYVGARAWSRLTHFAINAAWHDLERWHRWLRQAQRLVSLSVLSPDTEAAGAPEGWEVRFQRAAPGAEPVLVLKAYPGAERCDPLVNGLRGLPASVRATMTLEQTERLASSVRSELEGLKPA